VLDEVFGSVVAVFAACGPWVLGRESISDRDDSEAGVIGHVLQQGILTAILNHWKISTILEDSLGLRLEYPAATVYVHVYPLDLALLRFERPARKVTAYISRGYRRVDSGLDYDGFGKGSFAVPSHLTVLRSSNLRKCLLVNNFKHRIISSSIPHTIAGRLSLSL
jgi:hypothetical protein